VLALNRDRPCLPTPFPGDRAARDRRELTLAHAATSCSAAEPFCGSALLHRPIIDEVSSPKRIAANALHLPASLCELIFSAASEACYEAWAWTRLAVLQSIRPQPCD
jgi:hypothetical protein